MKRNHRLLLAATVVTVLLVAASALSLRSRAMPAAQEPVPGVRAGRDAPAGADALVPQAPVPGGPGFLMLDPCAFRPGSSTTTWAYYDQWQLYNPGPADSYFTANLSLPNNVTITQVVVYFYDKSEKDLQVVIWRDDPGAGGDDAMALVVSSGAVDQYRNEVDASINFPVFDQQSYSYAIEVDIPAGDSSLRLTGVRIDYSYATDLPLVVKGD